MAHRRSSNLQRKRLMKTQPQRPTSLEPVELATALRRVLGSGKIDCETSTCPEVVRILDEYAERLFQGEDAMKIMPEVRSHLEECPDCCEECDALLRILGGDEIPSCFS